ncbi:MAG: DNA translocase FtsK 4TM domain-containing protein, partial [Desulfosarcinaceae bacterium]
MRKEITGILLTFLVIFTLISLLSYHQADPSINHARAVAGANSDVQNLFGTLGAHVAGLLVGLFGLGAFWVPILLLLCSLCFFSSRPTNAVIPIALGGLLLLVTTGSLLAFKQDFYHLFGGRFSAGGIVGHPLKTFLVRYTNLTGGLIILGLTWLIGFILATGFSLVAFYKRAKSVSLTAGGWIRDIFIKKRERREKARKRQKRLKDRPPEPAAAIKIQAPVAKAKPRPKPAQQKMFDFMGKGSRFQLPEIGFLDDPEERPFSVNDENLR